MTVLGTCLIDWSALGMLYFFVLILGSRVVADDLYLRMRRRRDK